MRGIRGKCWRAPAVEGPVNTAIPASSQNGAIAPHRTVTAEASTAKDARSSHRIFGNRLYRTLPHGEQDGMRSRRFGCEVPAVRMKQQAMVLTG